jgi:hypothetical protein
MITVPLLCAVTTVFRAMAPTKISMARRSAVSLRDIECLRGSRTQEHSIHNYTDVKRLAPRARVEKYTSSLIGLFARLSPAPEPPGEVVQGHSRF